LAFGLTQYPVVQAFDLEDYGTFVASYTVLSEATKGGEVDVPLQYRPCTEEDFGISTAIF